MGSCWSNSDSLFDEVRGTIVPNTPEERVRQKLLRQMIHALGYPKELIVVEKELKELPHLQASPTPHRRLDILCYGKDIHPQFALYPLILIECKHHVIDAKAIEQITGYNAIVRAYCIALASEEEQKWGYLDQKTKQYIFHTGIPHYRDLITWLRRQ